MENLEKDIKENEMALKIAIKDKDERAELFYNSLVERLKKCRK